MGDSESQSLGSSIRTGVILAIITAVGCGAIHWKYGKKPRPPVVIDPPKTPLERGKMLYKQNCQECHGPKGYGMPKQGANLVESKFVAETSDPDLVDMIEKGRTPSDPKSVLKLVMPPKGNNQALKTNDLFDIVEYVRTLQLKAKQEAEKE